MNLKSYTSGSPTIFTDPFGFATAPPVAESNCSPPKNHGANHIEGRGRFDRLFGGDPFSKYTIQEMKDNFGWQDGDITPMIVYATWIADPAEFKDNGGDSQNCCCCDEIGYAQIIKSKTEFDKVGFSGEDHDWKFDSRPGSIHYPRNAPDEVSTTNPCADKAIPIELLDLPARSDSWVQRLVYWKFEAETCVVCLKGKEGPSKDLKRITTVSVRVRHS